MIGHTFRAGTALTGLLALVLGGATASAADGDAETCAPAVERLLAAYGLSLASMQDVRWRIDHWQDDEALSEEMRPISGYRFYGRPPECATGVLVIYMWSNCGISDARTRHGCRVHGLPYGLF